MYFDSVSWQSKKYSNTLQHHLLNTKPERLHKNSDRQSRILFPRIYGFLNFGKNNFFKFFRFDFLRYKAIQRNRLQNTAVKIHSNRVYVNNNNNNKSVSLALVIFVSVFRPSIQEVGA